MIRLIDAYKIPEVSCDPKEEAAFRQTIDEQPAVEAIPISFIEEQIKECEKYDYPNTAKIFTALIKMWDNVKAEWERKERHYETLNLNYLTVADVLDEVVNELEGKAINGYSNNPTVDAIPIDWLLNHYMVASPSDTIEYIHMAENHNQIIDEIISLWRAEQEREEMNDKTDRNTETV